jgi:hypothetical protein
MTPEDRAQRALLDSPYRTPKERIAREIHEALEDQRASFREIVQVLVSHVGRIESTAPAEEAGELREAIAALTQELEEAQRRLRPPQ